MAPKSNWIMHLYKASVDTGGATPYSTVPLATIAGYSGYATLATYIIQSGKSYEGTGVSIDDVSASTFGAMFMKMMFRVDCYPFKFDASSDPDIDDIDTLRNFINGSHYMWVRFQAGSRNQPSTTAAYPIVIRSIEETIKNEFGTHGVTLEMIHKYRMSSY